MNEQIKEYLLTATLQMQFKCPECSKCFLINTTIKRQNFCKEYSIKEFACKTCDNLIQKLKEITRKYVDNIQNEVINE